MVKKILITGENGYIGTSLEEWLLREPDKYVVDSISVRGEAWKEKDFSPYDVIFHAAGIAHNSTDSKFEDLYYQVNRDLTVAISEKAKESGVSQFIFMSSMIVYGNNSDGRTTVTPNTKPNPDNFYGNSKLQAEMALKKLVDDKFKIVILRPPMIYGKGSKGNYPLLAKLAKVTLVFPDYMNKRSMLHIDNLCKLVELIITDEESGTFYPQNAELVQTSEIVRLIAENYGHIIWFTKIGNPLIRIFFNTKLIKKVFGDLYYLPSMSQYKKGDYQIVSLKESIRLTEE